MRTRAARLDSRPDFAWPDEYVALDMERVVEALARLEPIEQFLEILRRIAGDSGE